RPVAGCKAFLKHGAELSLILKRLQPCPLNELGRVMEISLVAILMTIRSDGGSSSLSQRTEGAPANTRPESNRKIQRGNRRASMIWLLRSRMRCRIRLSKDGGEATVVHGLPQPPRSKR